MNQASTGELGRSSNAGTAHYSRGSEERKPLGWAVLGVVAGLLIWVIAMPFLGDPRISHKVTPASVEGPRFSLLAARSLCCPTGTRDSPASLPGPDYSRKRTLTRMCSGR